MPLLQPATMDVAPGSEEWEKNSRQRKLKYGQRGMALTLLSPLLFHLLGLFSLIPLRRYSLLHNIHVCVFFLLSRPSLSFSASCRTRRKVQADNAAAAQSTASTLARKGRIITGVESPTKRERVNERVRGSKRERERKRVKERERKRKSHKEREKEREKSSVMGASRQRRRAFPEPTRTYATGPVGTSKAPSDVLFHVQKRTLESWPEEKEQQ